MRVTLQLLKQAITPCGENYDVIKNINRIDRCFI